MEGLLNSAFEGGFMCMLNGLIKQRRVMEIKYFQDTDTLLVNFTNKEIVDTRSLNENILIELDQDGNLVSMTIEHAKQQANILNFSYQQVAIAG
jgi:uncharacterized protein YuzE